MIDGTAILYRSHFAFIHNQLTNDSGFVTSAIYGVINTFIKLMDQYHPDHVMITFDRKAPTFRHKLDENYKANRSPMPDDLVLQIEPVKEFFEFIGIPELSIDGYEADDVIGTFTHHFKDALDIYIVSGDKDFAQLVDEHVFLLDPFKGVITDRAKVQDKYGIEPEQFIDFLAIVGDSADNIKGVKGIGPKGASKLLNEYNNLTGIYENMDRHKGATLKKLTASKVDALLSFDLAKIDLHVPMDIPELDQLICKIKDLHSLYEYLDSYNLKALKNKVKYTLAQFILKEEPVVKAVVKDDYDGDDAQLELFGDFNAEGSTDSSDIVEQEEEKLFEAILIEELDSLRTILLANEFDYISIDTETTSLNTQEADIVGLSFCYEESKAYYVPLAHFANENLPKEKVFEILKEGIKDKLILGHNLKYDLEIFAYHGLDITNSLFDTLIAASVLASGKHGMKLDICAEYDLDYTMKPLVDLIGKGKNQITFDSVPVDDACFYAAEDAWAVLKLYHKYKVDIKQSGLDNLFSNIEIPLINAIKHIEMNGAFVDSVFLKELSINNSNNIEKLVKTIYEIAGYQFNINSPKQLAVLLFEDMEITPIKKTKTGYSTDASVLEELSKEHKIADLIVQYRTLAKLESTYIKALPKLINPASGRIHSSFNQVGTSTGRLSSSNPNLQNIPIRSDLGKQIRKAFTAQDKDSIIVAADYSQIELRLLAIFSQDPTLVKTFNEDGDIHRGTASLIFNKPAEEITDDERRSAKTINFGIIYGMGARKLSQELDISTKEAKKFIENYFDKFPTIKKYMSNSVLKAKVNGFCETISGRRLILSGIASTNKRLVGDSERVAVNMPIQGSAADVIKIAMVNLYSKLQGRDDVKMIIQVHDELVFEVKESSSKEIIEIIRSEMESALPEEYRKIVKMSVDIGVGKDWLEAH